MRSFRMYEKNYHPLFIKWLRTQDINQIKERQIISLPSELRKKFLQSKTEIDIVGLSDKENFCIEVKRFDGSVSRAINQATLDSYFSERVWVGIPLNINIKPEDLLKLKFNGIGLLIIKKEEIYEIFGSKKFKPRFKIHLRNLLI